MRDWPVRAAGGSEGANVPRCLLNVPTLQYYGWGRWLRTVGSPEGRARTVVVRLAYVLKCAGGRRLDHSPLMRQLNRSDPDAESPLEPCVRAQEHPYPVGVLTLPPAWEYSDPSVCVCARAGLCACAHLYAFVSMRAHAQRTFISTRCAQPSRRARSLERDECEARRRIARPPRYSACMRRYSACVL